MKMKTRRDIRRMLTVLLCLVIVFSSSVPCFAEKSDTLTVKVGFFAFEGYHMQDEYGTRSGYGYEIMQHIAGYAGLRFEYVGYDKSWSEMQEMLENGEIDIVTSAQKTPEREAHFDFSTTNIGVSSAILTVKAGDDSFDEYDYGNWSGIRVGMIEGSSRNQSFKEYAEEHGFTVNPVYFQSTEEMIAELQSDDSDKSIDAILSSNLRLIKNEWIITQYGSSPFFAMVQKGNTELLDRINNAIAKLDSYEPGLRTRLMNKYYATDNDIGILLTAEERAYISSMKGKSITALLNPDRAPYSWYADGEYHGILYDISQMIISATGLDIEFVDTADRNEYERLIDSGDIKLRFDADCTYNQAEKENYWLTPAYITVPLARLYREDTKRFDSVAIPVNQSNDALFDKNMEKLGISVTRYNSLSEAVQAVMDKEQDMAYLVEESAMLMVRDDATNRLMTETLFGEDISYAVAVNRDQSPLLYSILSKAISNLNAKDINAIRQGYVNNLEKPVTVIGYFYDYPLHALAAAVVVLGIVILIVILLFQASGKKKEHNYLQNEMKQNELLKDALAAAEKAGAAKSQFLSRVSHEMRTPLNAIIGFIELAKNADREQKVSYLASTDLAAKQLLNVINDVLDMSSIESGKMKLSNVPFDFRHLISSITNIYGTQCKQKGVSYETKIVTPTEDWIVGDELRLNQILMNLLGNAVKFTSEGHIWLTVSQTACDDERLFLRFTVSDTGCGMSEEMMERLFKPFEQESSGTARKYGGSGLGLSIVKNLVSLMDGTIKAESKQGEGTTFTVDLPFLRSNVKQEMNLTREGRALHILAVDDEENERVYIGTVLERIGVQYNCVSSGGEALRELEQAESEGKPYNVCLVDMRMPGMDGIDTTRRIREKYGKDFIIIVVSAYDFQMAGESAKEAGANIFLSKPLFQSSLFDLLMNLSEGRWQSKMKSLKAGISRESGFCLQKTTH